MSQTSLLADNRPNLVAVASGQTSHTLARHRTLWPDTSHLPVTTTDKHSAHFIVRDQVDGVDSSILFLGQVKKKKLENKKRNGRDKISEMRANQLSHCLK